MTSIYVPDIREMFLNSKSLSNKGRFFLGIGQFTKAVTKAMAQNPKKLTSEHMRVLTIDYQLRVYISGCYFLDPASNAWINDGLEVSSIFLPNINTNKHR